MFFSSITVIKSSLSIAATFWKSIVRWWIGSTQNTVKISLNLLVIFMLLDTVAWQHSSDENRRENTQESCHKRRKQGRLSQKRQWEGTRQHLQAIHNRAAHKWTLEIIYRNIFCCNFFFKSMKSFVDRDVQRGEGKLHVKVRTSLGTSACYPIMNACKEKMIFVFLKTGCFNFCVWLLCKNIQFDKSSVIWFNCIDPITKS